MMLEQRGGVSCSPRCESHFLFTAQAYKHLELQPIPSSGKSQGGEMMSSEEGVSSWTQRCFNTRAEG